MGTLNPTPFLTHYGLTALERRWAPRLRISGVRHFNLNQLNSVMNRLLCIQPNSSLKPSVNSSNHRVHSVSCSNLPFLLLAATDVCSCSSYNVYHEFVQFPDMTLGICVIFLRQMQIINWNLSHHIDPCDATNMCFCFTLFFLTAYICIWPNSATPLFGAAIEYSTC